MAVNETTIPEPTALEVAAESILQELTDGNSTTADVAAALKDALEAIKESVAEELANTKLTVGISLGTAANQMETTTTGDMDSTTGGADMESTTLVAEDEMTSTASSMDSTTTILV